ncbi:MAG: ABC transporter substrate-binding protein [Anaerolineae bacterium]|nr:ABC transporter substrate-binding protein [Anaerolineae bacterium]MDW8070342.1 ABC transporter substrate-binding protein [Anaerolineae bacterium]
MKLRLAISAILMLLTVTLVLNIPQPIIAAGPEQKLVLAVGDELGPGNPHDYSSNMVLLDLIYEPLVRYGPDGTIQPALAEAWEISPDGLTWTFRLRRGVVFQDGTPFDAEVAKWNFERWVGVERHGWLPSTKRIVGIDTPDQYTFVLRIDQPYYPSIQDLTLIRPVRFLSPRAVNEAGEFVSPVGTGPWKVESLDKQRVVLVRHEDYWGEKPLLDRVILEVILDAQTRMAALLSGEVDVIGGEYLGAVSLESLPILERNPQVRVLTGDPVMTFYVSTQYGRPPFDDVRVRRALNMAIDRAGISQTLFGGKAQPARGLFPSIIPYVTYTGSDIYNYDPQRAAALLAEAGWKPNPQGILEKEGAPLKMTLVVDQSQRPQTVTIAQAMQAQFKAIGVELEVRAMDYSGWLNAHYTGEFDLIMDFSWGPPYDPHSLLSGTFTTRVTPGGHGIAYADATLDQLIESVLAAVDENERQSLYNQIWQYLDEVAAVIPLVYPERVFAVRSQVQGFRMGGTEYDLAYAVQKVTITD